MPATATATIDELICAIAAAGPPANRPPHIALAPGRLAERARDLAEARDGAGIDDSRSEVTLGLGSAPQQPYVIDEASVGNTYDS